MRAGWISKVGVVVLFLATSSPAESIPVEYFEGRIVGAHRLGLGFIDSEDGLASFDLSTGTGLANRLALFAPGLLTYTPRNLNDKWKLQEQVSGEAQAGRRLRYSLGNLQHHEDESAQVIYGSVREQTISSWDLSHELSFWSADSYEIGADKSLYLMMQGNPWFEAGEYHAVIHHGYREHTLVTNETSIPPYGTSIFEIKRRSSSKYPTLASSAQLGIGEELLLESNVMLSQERYDANSVARDSILWGSPAIVSSESTQKLKITDGIFDVGLTRFWGAGTWGTLNATIGVSDLESEGHDFADGAGLYVGVNQLQEVAGSSTSGQIAFALTCISNPEAKPVQFLLDRFSRYYGLELPSGATLFFSRLYWSIADRGHSASSRDLDGDSIFYTLDYEASDETTEHQFGAEFAHSHFFQRNLVATISASALLTPNLADSRDACYQNLDRISGQIVLEYWSYQWNIAERRQISWAEVANIDYLLGPLVREDDYRIRLEFEPRREESNIRLISPSAQTAFGDRQIESQYFARFTAIHGLNDEVDISGSISARFLSWGDDWQAYDRQYWDIGSSLRWQPTSYLRLGGRLATQVYNQDSIIKFFGDETSSSTESTTWSLETTVALVF